MSKCKRKVHRIKSIIAFFIIASITVCILKIGIFAYNKDTASVERTAAVVGIDEAELKDLMGKAEDITNAFDSITRLRSKIVDLFVNSFISLGKVSEGIVEKADDDTLNNLKTVVIAKLTDLKDKGINISESDIESMAEEITEKISEKMSADAINEVIESGNIDTLFDSLVSDSKFKSFITQFIEKMKEQMMHLVV